MASTLSEYTIGGVKIVFPCKAYPSQLAMMNAIVRGLNYKQHCLLESPTGSGKSLALLCSALAWQQSLYGKLVEDATSGKEYKKPPQALDLCQCKCHSGSILPQEANTGTSPSCYFNEHLPVDRSAGDNGARVTKPTLASKLFDQTQISIGKYGDDDFQDDRKRVRPLDKVQWIGQSFIFPPVFPPEEVNNTTALLMKHTVYVGAATVVTCLSFSTVTHCQVAKEVVIGQITVLELYLCHRLLLELVF